MKLTPLRSNMTELEIGDKTILFSYKTPVAYFDKTGCYRTNKKWSTTTSRHINQWFKSMLSTGEGLVALGIDQSALDNLVK